MLVNQLIPREHSSTEIEPESSFHEFCTLSVYIYLF